MRRFCPKCGKTITEDIFCIDCTPNKFNFTPPSIQVSEFNRTWHKGVWHQFGDLETLIISRVKEELKMDVPIVVEPFEFEFKKKEKIELICKANINGKEVELPVKVSYRQCDMGEKAKSKYFEGILQLRGNNSSAFEFIEHELSKVSGKGIFISKTEDVINGVDLYLTNKNYIKLMAQKLHDKFGALISINSQLFSKNHLTSKDIYRINALVTFLQFEQGDVIFFNYEPAKRTKPKEYFVLVKKMGKLITGQDLETSKPVSFESKYLKEAKKIDIIKTKIISVEPKIQILNPKTYQSEEIANSIIKSLEIDDEIFVVLTKVGNFIVGYPFSEDSEDL
jgi:NMD protein affecting ribosome stability and mRNA decay